MFPTTRLSLVLAAAQSEQALAALCRMYWQPLYAFIRRQGYTHEEAQDLTQGFIARLLEKGVLRRYQRERGRFRSFLLGSLKHYLANERDAAQAQKRGGGVADAAIEPEQVRDDLTPEKIFEKQWAMAVLNRALDRLKNEKGRHSESLSRYLTGNDDAGYRQAGIELGMSEGAVKVAVHRLRQRFHEILREEISVTVTDPAEIGDEIRYLMAVLRA